jgi:hypothetical protein
VRRRGRLWDAGDELWGDCLNFVGGLTRWGARDSLLISGLGKTVRIRRYPVTVSAESLTIFLSHWDSSWEGMSNLVEARVRRPAGDLSGLIQLRRESWRAFSLTVVRVCTSAA